METKEIRARLTLQVRADDFEATVLDMIRWGYHVDLSQCRGQYDMVVWKSRTEYRIGTARAFADRPEKG